MKLVDLLPVEDIVPALAATDKSLVLAELSLRLAPRVRLPVNVLLAKLEERERLGSTAVGEGVALPHCKLTTAAQIAVSFGLARQGLPFEEPDGLPVQFILGVVSPTTSSLHLKVLARAALLFRSPSFRHALLQTHSAEEIRALFLREEARQPDW